MAWERFKRHGKDVSFRGIPWNDSFGQKEGRHLRFERWYRLKHPEDNSQTDITIPRDSITVVDSNNVSSLAQFIARRRRRIPHG